jgi:hypothetical protein
MLLRRELVKSRIVCFLNVRFDKKGLITKPLLKEKNKKKKLIFRYLLKTRVRL